MRSFQELEDRADTRQSGVSVGKQCHRAIRIYVTTHPAKGSVGPLDELAGARVDLDLLTLADK